MKYVSTRGKTEAMGFQQAVMTGLAPDGGLLLPAEIPQVTDKLEAWAKLDYPSLAAEVMALYCDVPRSDLDSIVARSYSTFLHPDIAPVPQVGDMHILELFHGPTLSFKDIALQFLGNMFEYILKQSDREVNILTATSGDTGVAAIHGVRGKDGIRIFVMHPHGRVSPSQERQMTTVPDENVFNIAVEGTFDDCQGIMKEIFRDLEFKDAHSLGSANSINWARVLAQIVYYFYAAFRVIERTGCERVRFSVPTGNFGDIFAAYVAYRMGAPIGKLVLATNENDILARYFMKGDYSIGDVVPTLSPSMDIQVASNFERYLYYQLGQDGDRVAEVMAVFAAEGRLPVADEIADDVIVAGTSDTAATLATIRDTYKEHGYLLDPHTAVGVKVGREHMDSSEPMIYVSTADPAKFSQAIIDATGEDLAHHEILDRLTDLPTRCRLLPSDSREVRSYMDEILTKDS